MVLERATKEILLYGGHDNDKADYLQSQPNVAYTQNAHWRNKEGVLQKRLGLKESTATGAPSSSATPALLHPIGDKLFTFVDGTAYAYDVEADEWTNTPSVPFFVNAEQAAASRRGELRGYAYYYYKDQAVSANNGYAVLAYSLQPDVTTVVVYDPDQTILWETTIAGSFPQIIPASGPVIVTCTAAGVLAGYKPDPQTLTMGGPDVLSSTCYTGRVAAGFERKDLETGFPWFVVSDPVDTTNYHRGGTLTSNYVCWMDTSGDLHAYNVDSTNEFTVTGSDWVYPLGTFHHEDTGRFYLVYNDRNDGTNSDDIQVTEYAVSSVGVNPAGFSGPQALHTGAIAYPLPIRATGVHVEADGEVCIAVNNTSNLEERVHIYRLPEAVDSGGTLTKFRLDPTLPYYSVFTGHRITGPMVEMTPTGSDTRILVPTQLQPFSDMKFATDIEHPQDSYTNYRFPTTTVLTDVTNLVQWRAVASVDTNQSRQCDFTDLHKQSWGGLVFGPTDDDLFIVNREVFTFEVVVGTYTNAAFIAKDAGADARVNVYALSFSQAAALPGITLGDGVVIPGGMTQWFDGNTIAEMTPGTPFMSGGSGADEIKWSSATGVGDERLSEKNWRRVQAVVAYTDAAGNTHRSAPSPSMYIYGLVPNSNDYEEGYDNILEVFVPLSMNPDVVTYAVELYVSDDAAGTPKLAGRQEYTHEFTDEFAFPVQVSFNNNAWDGTTTATDANTEALVRYTPPIYTAGGVLPSDQWPAITTGVATSRRLWALSAEDTGQVYYSKEFRETFSPEFSAPLVISLGDERKLTAIGRLDDKVVVFERDAIHVIYGPGPTDTGASSQGGGFDVHNVTSTIGCSQPASLVETNDGLMFYSVRGFYLLDRSLKLHFIGAPAYDLSYNKTINTAVVIPEWGEVRFNIADATTGFIPEYGFAKTIDTRFRPVETRHSRQLPLSACLVYNYEFNRWTLFTGYRGLVSARTESGRYAHIKSDWSIEVESRPEDDYYDSQMYIETTWIPVSDDMQGNARVRRATLLGKYLSSNNVNDDGVTVMNDLRVEVLYDYEEDSAVSTAAIQTEFHDWRSNVELADYPYSVPWRMQVRFKPGRQKCQSMKFRIYDTVSEPYWITGPAGSWDDAATYATGRGYEISSINLDLGVKPGPVRSLPGKRKQ